MSTNKVLTDPELLGKTVYLLSHLIQNASQEQYDKFMKVFKAFNDEHHKQTGMILFPATLVFVKCVRSMRGDFNRTVNLLENTKANIGRIFIQEFSLVMALDRAMEKSETMMEEGKIQEGIYLQHCELYKNLYEIQENFVKTGVIHISSA